MEPSSPAIADDALWRLEGVPVDQLGYGLVEGEGAVGEFEEGGVRVDGLGVRDVYVWDDLLKGRDE